MRDLESIFKNVKIKSFSLKMLRIVSEIHNNKMKAFNTRWKKNTNIIMNVMW
jgi:hypothetical protein